MTADQSIFDTILTMEAQASAMQTQASGLLKSAAMLRRKLLAGGRSVATRKGKKIDPEVAAMASVRYEKRRLKRVIKNQA